MPTKNESLDEKYFEGVYAAKDDPWDFETSEYEAAKYAATIDALPRGTYERVLEIGCSIGVLTQMLASRAKHLVAIDVSDKALEKAKEKNAGAQNIQFEKRSLPTDLPDGDFDLIVISEVAYYLNEKDWATAMTEIYRRLKAAGDVILVHWLPEVHDYPQTGDEVHESFAKFAEERSMKLLRANREENYRLDVWRKAA